MLLFGRNLNIWNFLFKIVPTQKFQDKFFYQYDKKVVDLEYEIKVLQDF